MDTIDNLSQGWIKLYRSCLENGWIKNHRLWIFWSYCLLKASHKEYTALIGNQQISLKPGDFIFGLKKAASETNLTIRQIRTCIDSLKTLQNMTIKTTNKFSIISLNNWAFYQGDTEETTRKTTRNRQTTCNIQEVKELKNIKPSIQNESLEHFISFWKAYPKRQAKQAAIQTWNKLNPSNGTLELILSSLEKQKAYKEHLKKTSQFCPEWPLPSTWLNGRRWEDEIESQGDKVPDNYFSKL